MGKPKAEPRLAENEALAYVKYIRTSPRKLNLVAQSIRGLSVEAALNTLAFSKKRVAEDVRKAVQSAVANAENNHELDIDRLVVAEATVGRTIVMKRMRPRARGRVGRLEKPFSNLRLVVRELPDEDDLFALEDEDEAAVALEDEDEAVVAGDGEDEALADDGGDAVEERA